MKGAVAGLKVLELGAVVAVPRTAKILADHGATVVKVESMTKPDMSRLYVPMVGGYGVNRCLAFAAWNNNKYGMGLNMKRPKALEVAKRLVKWCDVLVENFTPGTLEKWGLGYEDLAKINPGIIMVRASLQGQTGPRALQSGTGQDMQGLAGLLNLVGYPGRVPVGSHVAITDFIAPWYIISAIIGALEHRQKTGEGQLIELSQLESGVTFLGLLALDFVANGRVAQAMGNRSRYFAPEGVYRCQGGDEWCAISVTTEQEWQSLCKVIRRRNLISDQAFSSSVERKKNEEALDRIIEKWTSRYSSQEVMEKMQAAGVPCGKVLSNKGLHEDPQLTARHHFWDLDHVEMGMQRYDSDSFKLSKTPASLNKPPPCLGEDTFFVCKEILGMADEEFATLLGEGIFE